MDMGLNKLWETVKDREAWCTASMGSQKDGHDWVTEQHCVLYSFMRWPEVQPQQETEGRLSSLSSVASHVWLFATPWTAACQASLSITNSWSLLKLMSIESVMPSNYLVLCHPLFLLPSIFSTNLSQWVGSLHQMTKVLQFHLQHFSSSNEYAGLISFRIDWFDLVAQGTLKSLLQHHTSKASILQRSAFFIVQLSHPYMTTGKPISLTIWTFVSKVSAF